MQQEAHTDVAQKELFIKMIISAWDTQNTRLNLLLEKLSDEQLSAETAPGRNTGTYLLGHLIAVNDGLFPLLEWGERKYPELDEVFLKNPDKSGLTTPSLPELRAKWTDVVTALAQQIKNMTPEAWFEKHTAVSQEDFEKELHRNKLNIIINRTNHQSYHLGQLNYLIRKSQ